MDQKIYDTPSPHMPDIREQLGALGINLQPVNSQQVAMITDRDFGAYYNPDLTGSLFYNKGVNREGIFVDGHLIGYAMTGLNKKDGKLYGEIPIMHISPQLRNQGLGTILNELSRLRLIDSDADILKTKVMDGTGKIEHLLKKQGFIHKGKEHGSWGLPLWERDVSTPAARQELRDLLEDDLRQRIETLDITQIKTLATEVERDNPYECDITRIVTERLQYLNILSKQKSHVNIFGYYGNKVQLMSAFIPREYPNKPLLPEERDELVGDYKLTLIVKGGTLQHAASLLKELGLQQTFKCSEDKARDESEPIGVIITTKPMTDRESMNSSAIQLALIAKRLL